MSLPSICVCSVLTDPASTSFVTVADSVLTDPASTSFVTVADSVLTESESIPRAPRISSPPMLRRNLRTYRAIFDGTLSDITKRSNGGVKNLTPRSCGRARTSASPSWDNIRFAQTAYLRGTLGILGCYDPRKIKRGVTVREGTSARSERQHLRLHSRWKPSGDRKPTQSTTS